MRNKAKKTGFFENNGRSLEMLDAETKKQKLEAEYTNKPVLIATGLYPSTIPD